MGSNRFLADAAQMGRNRFLAGAALMGAARMRAARMLRPAVMSVLGLGLLVGCATLEPQPVAQEPTDYLRARPADVKWFQEAKFGLFIHWGPVSLVGKEIGWSRAGERRGIAPGTEVPVEEYDNLYKRFDPVQFNADEWVAIAKAAGMRYLVFTTKHHDGFSMFDTRLSDYKITNTPFGRDVCAELADACRRGGLRIGWYYSPVDWYHPDYRTENHARYIAFMHGQLRELCTRYGKIDIIWFDGLGGTAEDWDSENLFKMLRTLQPGVLLNRRAGLDADFDTPEQQIGRFQVDRQWETCMTIGEQWSWRPNDIIKSTEECLHVLARTVGGGGNLLFNVGPMPTGEIEPRQVERLKEMGRWLKINGASVYRTQGGPFLPNPWGVSTHRRNRIYVHLLIAQAEPIRLPAIPRRVTAARILGGGRVKVEQNEQGITLTLLSGYSHEAVTVVELRLDGPANEIAPVALPSDSVAFKRLATQSGRKREEHSAAEALDDDYTTFWLPDMKVTPAWLEVDLGEPTRVDRVVICELLNRVRSFSVEYRDGEEWRAVAEGASVGAMLTLPFEPVVAQHVRLVIREAEGDPHRYFGAPQISEFQVFAADR